jgi:peptidoglycan/LPS O-acetylase OafA/YrhL
MTATTTARFEALDGLRGVAALAIVIYHIKPVWGGYLAVDFFFVLSGFVLSISYLYRRKISVWQFTVRRLFRLYPLHIFSLATFTLAMLFVYDQLPDRSNYWLETLIQNLTLTQNIGLAPNRITWNYPSWSISVEFWIGILFILLISRSSKISFLILLSGILLLVIFFNTGHLEVQAKNYYGYLNAGLVRGGACFLLGVAACSIYEKGSVSRLIKKHENGLEVLIVVSIASLLIIRSGKLSELDYLAPPLFMIAVLVFANGTGFLAKLFSKLKFLGTISYSIYLNHLTILLLVNYYGRVWDVNWYATLFASFALLFLWSYITYRYIEWPCQRFGRHFG